MPGGETPPGWRHALGRIKLIRFDGRAWRAVGTRFIGSVLSSAGSRSRGGRFNPPGAFEVLYLALWPDTALAERDRILLTAGGIKTTQSLRRALLVRVECRLGAVIDLGDEAVRSRLGMTLAQVVAPWVAWDAAAGGGPAPTQALGAAIRASGRFEAIAYPSTKDPEGRCLAVFADCLRAGSRVAVDDRDGTIRAALGLSPEGPRRRRARVS